MIYYTNNRDMLSKELVDNTMKIPLDVLSHVTTLLNLKDKSKRGDITFYSQSLNKEELYKELGNDINRIFDYEIKSVDKCHMLSISSTNKLVLIQNISVVLGVLIKKFKVLSSEIFVVLQVPAGINTKVVYYESRSTYLLKYLFELPKDECVAHIDYDSLLGAYEEDLIMPLLIRGLTKNNTKIVLHNISLIDKQTLIERLQSELECSGMYYSTSSIQKIIN